MGLGKTGTAALWLQILNVNRALVVAPREIINNLYGEIPNWTQQPVFMMRSRSKVEREIICDTLDVLDEFILLVNIESWRRDKELLDHLTALHFEALIIDEAHHVNNSETSAFKGVRDLVYAINQCPSCSLPYTPEFVCTRKNCKSRWATSKRRYCNSCGFEQRQLDMPDCKCGFVIRDNLDNVSSIKNVLAMTGTPIINQPEDFWPLLHLVDKDTFPSKKTFLKTFCIPDADGKQRFRTGGQKRLLTMLDTRYLQRKREDAGIVLPPQSIEVLEYDFDKINYPDQWTVYQQIKQHFALKLEDETVSFPEIITQIMRLRQAITWPAGINIRDPDTHEITSVCKVEQSQKLDICERLIREYVNAGQRCVAFSHFRAPLRELQRRLGARSVVYDGGTDADTRAAIRADFAKGVSSPLWDVALCNYRSAGEGVTLIGATQTIVIDEDWSPAKNEQAYGRTNRIGQEQETRVHIPRILQTIDTWMAGLIRRKALTQDGFQEAITILRDEMQTVN